METTYPPAPDGFELHLTNTSLGRRLLLSHTEIARKVAAGELKPRGRSGYGKYHYSVEDLDRVRADVVAKVSSKFSQLNANERQGAIAAEFAAVHASHHFRATPSKSDVQAGQLTAEKLTANAARGHVPGRQQLGARMNMRVRGPSFSKANG